MNPPQSRGDERTFAIIGAAMEVHRVLRRGFLEAIYYEALAHEFRDIPFACQVPCSVEYKGQRLHGVCRLDFGRPSLEYRRFALSDA